MDGHDRPMKSHRTLINSLRDPKLYEHPVRDISVLETHISSIVLTGTYAYKIKKPVKFDFLDFTSKEQRKYYCQRELKLNRRLCPDLYRSVVSITGSPEKPTLNGSGETVDYAVKMVQFDQENLLARRAENDNLPLDTVEEVVDTLADFHANVETIPTDKAPAPDELQKDVRENFQALDDFNFPTDDHNPLRALREWSEQEFEHLKTGLLTRREDGFVRNCHGDVHLGNIVLHERTVKIFDCIEFNEEYRYIDVMNELAFLTMDLYHRNYPELARWALNRYVTKTGDHAGLQYLDFFRTYRAMVRAKVNHLEPESNRQETLGHIRTAHQFTMNHPKGILLTHGFSGTGKTTQTDTVIQRHGAIRIRSDVERKRLAGIPFRDEPEGTQTNELYSPEMTDRTYEELLRRSRTILKGGFPVVVDATFLNREYRGMFRRLGRTIGVPFGIIKFDLPEETIRKRLRERKAKESISDAGVQVFEEQLSLVEPVKPSEAPLVLTIHEDGMGEEHHRKIQNFLGNETFKPKKTSSE